MIPKHLDYFTKALINYRRSSGNLLLCQTLHSAHVAAFYFYLDEQLEG
ncbi:hypothetical protein JZM40_15110 [Acinetobacter pittii]|uniref:Uncharacterized protein n=1 Tax=Acinetobacter haemolyticus TaxID=29430 RepID=A0AAW4J3R9_ACIHA|nr:MULTISPECIES: hypothetical protein [Acinetobacter]MBN6532962.1 hypothetical protein [Acinetobacter pittii]MBO3656979.1 hypothetical protein [Acinetobacter haemolyticus]